MARTRQSSEFEIEVGGEAYVWRIQRQPQEAKTAAERRGMAIAVRHREGQREAVVEFPPAPVRKFGAAQMHAAQIPPDLVAKAIASAIEAGWEPLSRGKTVAIVVDAMGN